jgi:DNA-binding IclR family transcriptional regulator
MPPNACARVKTDDVVLLFVQVHREGHGHMPKPKVVWLQTGIPRSTVYLSLKRLRARGLIGKGSE